MTNELHYALAIANGKRRNRTMSIDEVLDAANDIPECGCVGFDAGQVRTKSKPKETSYAHYSLNRRFRS